jgi:hypothetical protein
MKVNMPGLIQDEVAKMVNAILPTMVQSIMNWIDGGRQGPFNMISLGASNSNNVAPDQNAPIMENPAANPNSGREDAPAANNAHGREDSSAVTVPCSSPSISCTPIRGPSTLAELDAITVIKRHKAQQVTSPLPSLTPYMFS